MENGQFRLIDLIDDMGAEKDIFSRPLRVARDIMNKEVKMLTLDHTVNACIKFMKNWRFRHAPVVDLPNKKEDKSYFVGVVSERDVSRLISPSVKKPGEQKTDRRALRQLLVQIVARKPKTVSPETPIPDVIMTMLDNHIDMVPVLADAEVVGIITTADITNMLFRLDKVIRQLCPELTKATQPADFSVTSSGAELLFSWVSQTVQEIMTEQVIWLTPQDNLAKAMRLMQEQEFRHVPVTDEQGKLRGIVSDRDILRHLHFAGRRPLSKPKKFRAHLFRVDPKFVNLELPLERIMTRKVTHVLPSCTVFNAAEILRKTRVSCLPVVDEGKNFRGIVTATNVMRALLAVYELTEKSHV